MVGAGSYAVESLVVLLGLDSRELLVKSVNFFANRKRRRCKEGEEDNDLAEDRQDRESTTLMSHRVGIQQISAPFRGCCTASRLAPLE